MSATLRGEDPRLRIGSPGVAVEGIERTRAVDQGLEGVLDNLLCQEHGACSGRRSRLAVCWRRRYRPPMGTSIGRFRSSTADQRCHRLQLSRVLPAEVF